MPTDHNPPWGTSTGLTSPSPVSADPPSVSDYDDIAEAYSTENETNLVNAYYERPAMLALAGDVDAGGFSTPAVALARCSRRCATGAPS